MKQIIIRSGEAIIDEIPAPQVEDGTILVEVLYSCISTGTEISGVRMSSLPLWKRALRQPENVKKVLELASAQGISSTWSLVESKVKAGNATGYSAAGRVVHVGAGVDEFQVGDLVACAGAQCAHHAEMIRVPKNLAVLIPDRVAPQIASTVTLGAIALQGVRRAQPTLGETFVVVGLGVLGQLTAQILKANGCQVIGTDLSMDRLEIAKGLGMHGAIHPSMGSSHEQVARLTKGYGADGVIITAGSTSDEIVNEAFKMCRKKGRVVLVGDVGLNLKRSEFYAKEIDFFISCSYGPGRYDHQFEERGIDYPLPYVRWTETRNMAEYLRLCADSYLRIEPLITHVEALENAPKLFRLLKNEPEKSLFSILKYNDSPAEKKLSSRVSVCTPSARGNIGVGIIGAGGFAKGVHLPNIRQMSDTFEIKTVMSRTGLNAVSTARQFQIPIATTDLAEIINNPEIKMVVISTRHDTHVEMALKCLNAGKHVLLEKPLAMDQNGIERIKHFYSDSPQQPMLLTGFNRRFSPYSQRIKEFISNRSGPMMISYRMNAGFIPYDHWVHGPEGGGRNIGEACHIYDLFTFMTESEVRSISAFGIRSDGQFPKANDNFSVNFEFADGTIANLIYTAAGSKQFPKEHLEIYFDGKVIQMTDYKDLEVHGFKASRLTTSTPEKGQKEELIEFAKGLKTGIWPIPLWQQIQATEMALAVEKQLRGHSCVE